MNKANFQENTKSELEFRLWFRDEFKTDYLEAAKLLQERRSESERLWRQMLINHSVI